MVKELFFPTQVYFFDFPDAKRLNRNLKRRIRQWRKAAPEGIVRSNVQSMGSWHSPVDMKTRPEYAEICQRIVDVAANIYTDLGYAADSFPCIDNMWANISPRYGFNREHNHPGVLWSGVYYVQAPANCGRLVIREPRRESTMIQPRFRDDQPRKKEVWGEVYYEPVPGRIIIFPGWLEHAVEPNLSTRKGTAGERISIAFNLIQGFKTD